MKMLFVLNDPPYGSEGDYNALRFAQALMNQDATIEMSVFLMADAVACARKGQPPSMTMRVPAHDTRSPAGR